MIKLFFLLKKKKRKRTEPHQDSAAYKAIVKWENAGKGIRQTGFVPSVYGLALVYGYFFQIKFKNKKIFLVD